jgi:hypothetical protein
MSRLTVNSALDSNGVPIVLMGWGVKAITTIKTLKLTFINDHKMLKDNASDWQNSGTVFPKPDFNFGKPSQPASFTKNREVELNVDFEVWPKDADAVNVTITGTAGWDSSLQWVQQTQLKGGVQNVRFRSNNKLPDAVVKLTGEIKWSVTDGSTTWSADHSWGHVLFVTMGTPDDSFGMTEAGVTVKRMDKAVDLVGRTGTLDPHGIVKSLMTAFPGYRVPGMALPDGAPKPADDVNWPTYLAGPRNDDPSQTASVPGGAWNIADDMAALAECQAIVRFVRGVLKQVGCPGKVETILVFADADTGAAKEEAWDQSRNDQGLKGETRMSGSTACFVQLTTSMPARVGVIQRRAAMNNFEACLRFTDPAGTVKYYPGGEAVASTDPSGATTMTQQVLDTKEQVLSTFQALVWIAPAGDDFRVVKIVKKYR